MMKKLLLLTFLFISFLCEAQQKTAIIEWQKTIGGNKSDRLNCIQPTKDGGYIFGGSSNSDRLGTKTDTCRGGLDYWIIKTNSLGSIEWQKTIGGSKDDILICIYQTTDSGYILGGYSNSRISGEKTDDIRGAANDYWIVKLSATGTIQWQKTIGGNNNDILNCLQQTTDGGYILGGYSASRISGEKTEDSHSPTYSFVDFWIVKINSIGAIEWQKVIGGDNDDGLYAIKQTSDGGYILGGTSNSGISFEKTESSRGDNDYWVVKINSIGNIEWQKTIGGNSTDAIQDINQTIDGGYVLGGISSSYISGDKTDSNRGNTQFEDYWIVKINSLGIIEWQKVYGGSNTDALKSINFTHDGGYILGGKSSSGISFDKLENFRGQSDYWILKVNSLGIIEWQKTIGGSNDEYLSNIIQTSDGSYIVGGYSWSNRSGEKTENNNSIYEDFWILKLNEIYANKISGKIFQSQNPNCSQEINEKGTPSVILKAEPNNFFYSISDTAGKYTILTDTGIYKVKPVYSNLLKPFLQSTACPSIGYHTISFSQYGQDTSEINFANYEKQCAYLQVALAQSRMRRCFDNTTAIKYCNIGNVDTNNVQVVVTLPEYVTFVSASNPNYIINGKKIIFNIGNLRANECGTINLITNVDCVNGITGLTQCISAYILPRNKCVDQIQPDYAQWDKSEIAVEGRCTGSTARFVIKNIGQNMSDSSSYRIYKDAVQAVSNRFKLNAGDSLVVNVSALGNTYRLEADQTAHYPSASTPNATIENCGTGAAARGFVNQMPQDMAAPHQEKICLPIRDSYDPNDKSVSPAGVGVGKLVKHKIPLDFLIRFQNTGTDTAYKVVVVDTLDKNLDLATLEFGASSHTYKIEFTGSGQPILKFTFDKINLVDSFTNEPKSHGFVSFKITPYDSIPNGTLVKNSADIYFDFNLPIKTNTTQVSIDDRLPTGASLSIVTGVKEQHTNYESIYVYPNPFSNSTNFEFVYNTKAAQLIVYDIKGELVAQENISGKTTYPFYRNSLPNGMYFYNIENNAGEIIGRGKLVLQ